MPTLEATPLAILRISTDPVWFQVGGFAVHWYGVMYALAFLAGFRLGVVPHLRRYGIDRGLMESVTGWTILWGLVGARLYYIVQSDIGYYLHHPSHIFAVWEGGMAFFGAIGAGTLAIAVLSRRHHLSFWLAFDAAVFFATVGQPIGRIGNVINGDILGPASTLPWATAYTNPHAILQGGFALCTPDACTAYQPAAVYEAIGTLLILGVLVVLRRRHVPVGVLAIAYVAMYAMSQLVIFQWRSGMPTYHGLAQAQWTALVTLFIGVPGLFIVWRRGHAAPPMITRAEEPAATHPTTTEASPDDTA